MDSTESSKNRGAKTSAEKVKFDPFKPKLDIHSKLGQCYIRFLKYAKNIFEWCSHIGLLYGDMRNILEN